ncbi:MAG TPA: glutamate-1-semialdehyde 2,1-aminomutase [Deltaproteobacteria bacterium]|nr:glutamate-1-semialdehyde 2,1-aminomutase [Deltaproteobacteria bacterium]
MKNADLFEKAKQLIPGGVNSPVRAFGKVGGTPRFIEKASGAYLYDAEGKKYIDHVLSWGPMILGHSRPEVVDAVHFQAAKGMSYGAPTEAEVTMAEIICSAFASIDKVRFVNSGTEATMSAIRLARAFTNREIVVKFEGCYHGHVDSLLAKAGSGALTFGIPDTSGVPRGIASTTAVLPYNNVECFEKFMELHGEEIAAVIVEPVAGNMGVVFPRPRFLETLRKQTHSYGSLLIFDEVITGFRFCFGGYQDLTPISPDLTCLGKIIGGGMPVGAFGGREDVMALLSPQGPVYQAGTLAGNPMAMAAGIATLRLLQELNPYARFSQDMDRYVGFLKESADHAGIPLTINHKGSMAGIFFHEGPVETFDDVMLSDAGRYARFFHAMLEEGVYLAPSPFEAFFISTAHTRDVLDRSMASAGRCLLKL